MGDSIERALEETIPILRAAQRAKLLSAEETSDVVRRRRDHEYAVAARNATRSDFLKYASFERELAAVLSKRAEKKKLKKQKAQLVIGKSAARVNLVYSRAVKKFHGDVDLWLHYARHCVRTGSSNAAGKVFAKALGYRGDSEEVWLAAVAFHFDTCGDSRGARALAQRALRALPDSINMWREYFRLEVCYLAKIISRRIAMGLPVSGAVKKSINVNVNDTNEQSPALEREKQGAADGDIQISASNHGVGPDSDEIKRGTITEEEDTTDDISKGGSIDGISPSEGALSQGAEQASVGFAVKLSFWDGGVPMAVYNRACHQVRFTAKHRADFWDIAAATPYVPIKLLESLSEALVQGCPDCIATRIISLRLPWDLAHARLREEEARAGEKRQSEQQKGEILSTKLEDKRQLIANQALEVLSSIKQTLIEAKVESLTDASKLAVMTCVESFASAAKVLDHSGATLTQAKKLLSELKLGKVASNNDHRDGGAVQEHDKDLDPTTWSVEDLASKLVSKKCPLSRQFYEVLKTKILVPFRGVDQERALCAWLSMESSPKRLHEICDLLLSLPPVTMESLRAAIGSELKVLERMLKQEKWSQAESEQMISQTRKLFKAAAGLPTARNDVDLWLDYVDFERRVTRDSKQATFASWKAMKALDQRHGELFTERQMLRNLAQ